MDTDETNNQEDAQPRHQQQRKKCHGNRKDQRFRRKCRVRGMKSGKIKKLLEKRKKISRRPNRMNGHAKNTRGAETDTVASSNTLTNGTNARLVVPATTASLNSHKRKRDDVSQSQTRINSISMGQPAPKKTKAAVIRMPLVTMNDGQINKSYRFVFLSIERSNLIVLLSLQTTHVSETIITDPHSNVKAKIKLHFEKQE